jgi:hypothetical protein
MSCQLAGPLYEVQIVNLGKKASAEATGCPRKPWRDEAAFACLEKW